MNKVPEIDREECCVCDGKEKGDLYSTTKEIATLAGEFPEFWKNGLLPFGQRRLQLIRRLNILISSMSCSENQLNIIITVTSNIHHVTSQGRKNHHEERTRKLKWGNLEPFDIHLLAHIVVHLQVQQSQILFALYAVNMMPLRTFMLQGHFMRLNRS